MNDKNTAIAYTEVDAILNMMDSKYVEKIPRKLRDMFKEERLNDYEPKINSMESLDNQNLQRETLVILSIIYVNYWCESEEERKNLIQKFAENEKTQEIEAREKYNPDNLFNKKVIEDNSDNILKKKINSNVPISNEKAIKLYKEDGILKKIWKKIINFLKK